MKKALIKIALGLLTIFILLFLLFTSLNPYTQQKGYVNPYNNYNNYNSSYSNSGYRRRY